MKIHKEGYRIISGLILILLLINILTFFFCSYKNGLVFNLIASLILIFFVVRFFRVPKREFTFDESKIMAPADGQIVIINETEENEYFKDKRLQVSIFMSAHNVHINWFPFSGSVSYYKYHEGRYIVAWHPKSSEKNERTTIVVKRKDGKEVLIRQIAGYVARRIVSYAQQGIEIKQFDQLGFIKFGSRVDLFLPLDAQLKIKLNDKVVGTQTIIAEL